METVECKLNSLKIFRTHYVIIVATKDEQYVKKLNEAKPEIPQGLPIKSKPILYVTANSLLAKIMMR